MKEVKESSKQLKSNFISRTAAFVHQALEGAEAGHDWWHIQRVWNTAKLIGKSESVDMLVVELGALLHDIADSKFHDGNEILGAQIAYDFLTKLGLDQGRIKHIQEIIQNISFKNSLGTITVHSKELEVVQDADRLDAMGAIGIARAFNYGGFKNRELYNPNIPPKLNMTKEEYKKSTSPTLNHFYEKLLLLKNDMNTPKGLEIAERRHQFIQIYLDEFHKEWEMTQ